jgi:hypothetical protein
MSIVSLTKGGAIRPYVDLEAGRHGYRSMLPALHI